MEIWSKLLGPEGASDWGAGLTAPINEEWGKALGLILLIGLAPRLIRSAYDGFVIGAFIGLGFEIFEDVLYVYNNAQSTFGVGQVGSSLYMFAIRGVSGIASHALFSAAGCPASATSSAACWTRDLLGPEVEAGVVDPELLTAVSGLRTDRKHYRKQLHSRRRVGHLIEGASDLAHEIANAGRAETPRVEHARAELLRLRNT